jgi:diacylglycerol kinase
MLFDALNGIRIAWSEERNFKIDVIVAVLIIVASCVFGLSRDEWVVVFFLIAIVLTAETFNTALEELCDKFHPDHDPHIGKIKDLSAGAVLISATAAMIIGCVIFIPHILRFLGA